MKCLAIVVAATLGLGSTAGFAATLSVGSWHVWAGSQALTKGTCTVTAASSIVDTYVQESSPGTSSGSAATALVRATTGSRDWMLVRFDLSGCALPTTAGADSATMKLVVKTTATAARTLTVTPVLSTWSGTLTWTQAQTLTYGSGATTTFSTGTTNGATLSVPVTIDVDALIKNPSASYGWLITDGGSPAGSTTTTFNSVDAGPAANRPQLVVNYEK
jgi:hypothetical protein